MNFHRLDLALVCFFDILGFRSLVTAPGDREPTARRLNRVMERALEAFGGKRLLKGKDGEWRIRVFSDCIVLAKPLTELGVCVTLDASAQFVQEMLAEGFPIRGGIEIGPYIETDFLLFSEAQIAAYDLESQVAKQPRVLVSLTFLRCLDLITDDEFRWLAKELLIMDSDGQVFLNYMVFYEEDDWLSGARFYKALKNLLTQRLQDTAMPSGVREKYDWMADLHNWSLWHTAKLLKRGRLNEDNTWDFQAYYVNERHSRRLFTPLVSLDKAFIEMIGEDDAKVILSDQFVVSGGARHIREGIDWIRDGPSLHEDDEPEEDLEETEFLEDPELYQKTLDKQRGRLSQNSNNYKRKPKAIYYLISAHKITPIEAWRRYLKLSEAAVARRLAISEASYRRLEKCTSPSRSTLKRVADALRISLKMLLIKRRDA